MITINEDRDGGRCTNTSCDAQAVYKLDVRAFDSTTGFTYTRRYCPEHTRELVSGMAEMVKGLPGEHLHDYLEIEHVVSA